ATSGRRETAGIPSAPRRQGTRERRLPGQPTRLPLLPYLPYSFSYLPLSNLSREIQTASERLDGMNRNRSERRHAYAQHSLLSAFACCASDRSRGEQLAFGPKRREGR